MPRPHHGRCPWALGALFLLLQFQSPEGFLEAQSQLICSKQTTVAWAGDDVTFQCRLQPPVDASSETVLWTRLGTHQEYIHVFENGEQVCEKQNPSYHYRTTLSVDQLVCGNISLKLLGVTKSDEGEYVCVLPSLRKGASVRLVVVSRDEEAKLIGSSQPIVALAGDDVVLPCHFQPPISASSKTVVWTRPDLDPKYVHVRHKGQLMCQNQHRSYTNRTRLFDDQLINGNISLGLSSVKTSDTGKYICCLVSVETEGSIQLIVGAVSSPVISVASNNTDSLVLQCKSPGWYPEPEVSWLDGEGNLLSAEPTETDRGPDGLYTVSSRVTVDKRHSNSFTCRVQQKNINQTRETHILVAADVTAGRCSLCWTIIIPVCLVVAATLLMCRRKRLAEERERMCQPPVQMYTRNRHT